MIFEIPQFFLARGKYQWVPRFLLLIGDTKRIFHDFLPHQKRLSWQKILHQTCVALKFSIFCAPCLRGLVRPLRSWPKPTKGKLQSNGHYPSSGILPYLNLALAPQYTAGLGDRWPHDAFEQLFTNLFYMIKMQRIACYFWVNFKSHTSGEITFDWLIDWYMYKTFI